MPNLERLLIAVDDSPNGKFASRVAGMLAGTHGMPTTVLHIPDATKIEDAMPEEPDKTTLVPSSEENKARATRSRTANRATAEKDDKKAGKRGRKSGGCRRGRKKAAAQIKSKQKDEEKVDAPVDGDDHCARSSPARTQSPRKRKKATTC